MAKSKIKEIVKLLNEYEDKMNEYNQKRKDLFNSCTEKEKDAIREILWNDTTRSHWTI